MSAVAPLLRPLAGVAFIGPEGDREPMPCAVLALSDHGIGPGAYIVTQTGQLDWVAVAQLDILDATLQLLAEGAERDYATKLATVAER